MNLAGVLPILAPPQAIDAALRDPAVLQRLLPACEGVDQVGSGRFRAHLARKMGLLTVRTEADLALVPLADGTGLELSLDISSRVIGSVSARLRLIFRGEPHGARLSWDGTVTAAGLAQRLLAERENQLGERLTGRFATLKGMLEGR